MQVYALQQCYQVGREELPMITHKQREMLKRMQQTETEAEVEQLRQLKLRALRRFARAIHPDADRAAQVHDRKH